jgi:hypothetical protein
VLIVACIRSFEALNSDISLHLAEIKPYRSGLAALPHEARRQD